MSYRRPTSGFLQATTIIRKLDEVEDQGLAVNDKTGNALLSEMNTKGDAKINTDNVDEFLALSKYQRERVLTSLDKESKKGNVEASNELMKLQQAHNSKRSQVDAFIQELTKLRTDNAIPNGGKVIDTMIYIIKREEEGKQSIDEMDFVVKEIQGADPGIQTTLTDILNKMEMSPTINLMKIDLGLIDAAAEYDDDDEDEDDEDDYDQSLGPEYHAAYGAYEDITDYGKYTVGNSRINFRGTMKEWDAMATVLMANAHDLYEYIDTQAYNVDTVELFTDILVYLRKNLATQKLIRRFDAMFGEIEQKLLGDDAGGAAGGDDAADAPPSSPP